MKQKNKFADNEVYGNVTPNKTFGQFVDQNGNVGYHKVATVRFHDKQTYHKKGTKNVVCKLQCSLNFNIPSYWRTYLTDYTYFTVVGVATCSDEDVFDLEKGKIIAQTKAENEAYKVGQRMLKELKEQLFNFAFSLDKPIENLFHYYLHNEKFIDKLVKGEITLKKRKK